jgi:hypothetical protein
MVELTGRRLDMGDATKFNTMRLNTLRGGTANLRLD